MEYWIIQCPYCGNYLAVPTSNKTKLCTYCGRRIIVMRAKRLARARDGREASIILRGLKAKKAGILDELYKREVDGI
ncbi:MAG: DUF1922 domain-containing protein [Thermoprotei archaeon]|nr:MAG: DUF1922 domain-containing protein [Thermoprotei archaeon]RLF19332.1 MAG: DUF1922 domain-containing protein [Thermoprotei archaeon]